MGIEILAQPFGETVGDRLIEELESERWQEFVGAVAFAKMSGVSYLDSPLRHFIAPGNKRVALSVGVDHGGTSFEAVSQLLGAVGSGSLFVAKHLGSSTPTFHPKAFAFLSRGPKGDLTDALLISGSTNFTEGGLFTNYEFSTVWTPDLKDKGEQIQSQVFVESLYGWTSASKGLTVPIDAESLMDLHERGWLPRESSIVSATKASRSIAKEGSKEAPRPPQSLKKQEKPPRPKRGKSMGPPAVSLPEPVERETDDKGTSQSRRPTPAPRKRSTAPSDGQHDVFFIDVNDTGFEIYLSKTALGQDPVFFGHPFTGRTDPKKGKNVPQPERDPRPIVDLRLLDSKGDVKSHYLDHPLKIWQYSEGPNANQDVRITIPAELRHSLPLDCILEMRRKPVREGIEYRLDFLSPGSKDWENARAEAATSLPGGKRSYGWG
jgi:hypothetical protein